MQALIGPGAYGNANYDAAMARINAIPGYRAMFEKAFPKEKDPVTPANWGKAIGAYERTLVSRSRFDAYLAGDANALTAKEQSGLRKFIGTGCIACHNGVGIGGGMYQKFGVIEEYWNATGSKTHDEGRFAATKQPSDMYVFKVPSLRNVARTPPVLPRRVCGVAARSREGHGAGAARQNPSRCRYRRHRCIPEFADRNRAEGIRHRTGIAAGGVSVTSHSQCRVLRGFVCFPRRQFSRRVCCPRADRSGCGGTCGLRSPSTPRYRRPTRPCARRCSRPIPPR